MKHAALLAALSLAACASQAAVHSAAPTPAGPRSIPSRTDEAVHPAPTAGSLPSCSHPIPAACDARVPLYARDVMPILRKRCFGCHTGDGVAADEHDFSRIEALREARTEIVDEVSTCAMPPRSRLDDDEANVLLRWVACGQRMD